MNQIQKQMLLAVLKEIREKIGDEINTNKLSSLLIELDKRGYNLTTVVEGHKGLCTPYLRYKIQDLIIFSILDNTNKPLHITKEGLEYIDKEIEGLQSDPQYKDFLRITSEVIQEKFLLPQPSDIDIFHFFI